MDLRSGTHTGAPQLSPPAKAGFEEGVGLIFSQWTALVLAVENQWGGSDSATKADYFIEDILEWFYRKKGEAWRVLLQVAEFQLNRGSVLSQALAMHVTIQLPVIICACNYLIAV